MNRFEFVAVLPANTVEHVRTIVVSDCRKGSSEKSSWYIHINQPAAYL